MDELYQLSSRQLFKSTGLEICVQTGSPTVTLLKEFLTLFENLVSRIRSKTFFSHLLEINTYLSQSIKVFEDFKLMAEMRQEIDKLNNV